MKFSVLMSVYEKEKPEFLRESLESILVNQTMIPTEVVLVE
ncbi:TPA: glycosyl transferase, partial [Streptococcus suis]